MNEHEPTPEPGANVGTDPESANAGTDPEGRNPNAEAANYRRRLRAAEAELEQVRQRLDATHRQEIERMAADRFTDPSDLWAVASVDDMRGEDGLIDPARAEAAMRDALGRKPHWAKPPPADPEPEPERFPTVHQGPGKPTPPKPPSFGAQLKDSLRGGG